MNIALDYDGTFDADPYYWWDVIEATRSRGHNIFIVTYRDKRLDRTPALIDLEQKIPVYYTGGIAKKFWCKNIGYVDVDVWIDDKPNTIYENSKNDVDSVELIEWRKTRQ